MSSLFQKIPGQLINQLASKLAETSKASASNLELVSKIETALQSPAGLLYRSVGDMRKETSRLSWQGLHHQSASIVADTSVKQSVYHPQTTPALGFMIDDAKVHALRDQLMTKSLDGQSPDDIQALRIDIVKSIQHGIQQTRFIPQPMYGDRQTGLNEAVISYSSQDVMGFSLLDHSFMQADELPEYPLRQMKPADVAVYFRQVAQLAYATAKLGVKPAVIFDGKGVELLIQSEDQWGKALEDMNRYGADNHRMKAILNNPVDGDSIKIQGMVQAAEHLHQATNAYDPESLKHIGGALTSVPYDVSAFTGKTLYAAGQFFFGSKANH